jgi:flagellar protein FlbT
MYLDQTENEDVYGEFARRLAEFMGAVRNPEVLAECVSISRDVMAGDFYRALMRCRKIIAYEDERLGNVTHVDPGLPARERAS